MRPLYLMLVLFDVRGLSISPQECCMTKTVKWREIWFVSTSILFSWMVRENYLEPTVTWRPWRQRPFQVNVETGAPTTKMGTTPPSTALLLPDLTPSLVMLFLHQQPRLDLPIQQQQQQQLKVSETLYLCVSGLFKIWRFINIQITGYYIMRVVLLAQVII